MKRSTRVWLAFFVGVCVAGGLAVERPSGVARSEPIASADASEMLAKVSVVPEIRPVAGYERGCRRGQGCVFGPAWQDPTDHSACDTRNRVLSAQLKDVVYKPGTRNCKVIAGWVSDPYTGTQITLSQIQIDHTVPLHRAWNAGAWQWSELQRRTFANDTRNLLAVSAKANESKGDSSLSAWLPDPGTGQQCPYVLRYLTVSAAYQLSITAADRAAAVDACPKGPLK